MGDFPEFMRGVANRIPASSQYTEGIEGSVYDGADGSQVAFWTCREDRTSSAHAHDFDEYVLVVEGRCSVITAAGTTELHAGQELLIPRGTEQRMAVSAGTRTVHVFGGRRIPR